MLIGQVDRANFLGKYGGGNMLSMSDVDSMIHLINCHITSDDAVLAWGDAQTINHLGHWPQPTRFYYSPVLIYARPPLPMAEKWLAWFTQDLDRRPPAACVIPEVLQDADYSNNPPVKSVIESLLKAYEPLGTVGRAHVYLRKHR